MGCAEGGAEQREFQHQPHRFLRQQEQAQRHEQVEVAGECAGGSRHHQHGHKRDCDRQRNQQQLDQFLAKLPKDERPGLLVPGGEMSHSACAEKLFRIIAAVRVKKRSGSLRQGGGGGEPH